MDGHWSGHVDLGLLGTADRWADLAVATWSTEWNYGPGWEQLLLDAYGIAPTPNGPATTGSSGTSALYIRSGTSGGVTLADHPSYATALRG